MTICLFRDAKKISDQPSPAWGTTDIAITVAGASVGIYLLRRINAEQEIAVYGLYINRIRRKMNNFVRHTP
jgi:hypothetical protein